MTTGSSTSHAGAAPKGAASLMSMFEPPPVVAQESSANKTNDNDSEDNNNNNPRASSTTTPLRQRGTALVAEAAETPPRNNNNNNNDNNNCSTPKSGPSSPSALLSMFDPPSTTTSGPLSPSSSSPPTTTTLIESPEKRRSSIPDNVTSDRIGFNERQATVRQGNLRADNIRSSEMTALLSSDDATPKPKKNMIHTNQLFDKTNNNDSQDNKGDEFQSLLFAPLSANNNGNTSYQSTEGQSPFPGQYSIPIKGGPILNSKHQKQSAPNNSSPTSWTDLCRKHLQPSTFAGAFMFLLYHIVFCLANGSAMVRPHARQQQQPPILGEMAKLTTVGILCGGPLYIYRLNQDIPAVYPSVDLFLAPFLAKAAATVDQTLYEDGISGEDTNSNAIFLASFAVLAAIGMLAAGIFLLLAATFKLANLGTFLPFSVLCGFFSAVGVLLWALAFSVDTNGKTWQSVFLFSGGDTALMMESVIHHLPSLMVGILMNILGPRHPFYVILLIILTLFGFYTTMWITGTTLEEAQEQQWFWSREQLSIPVSDTEGFLASWVPPVPFGHFGAMLQGQVHWRAVRSGLKDMLALAFLYLLRSSIHASAMKKNVNNLVCKKRTKIQKTPDTGASPSVSDNSQAPDENPSYTASTMDAISDNVRLVNESLAGTKNSSGAHQSIRPIKSPRIKTGPWSKLEIPADIMAETYEYTEVRPKPCRRSLQDIFVEYGYGLITVAFSGGFGVCPTVATSNTMYAIGAGGPAPQFGSILLLIFFYATDFELVRYIPKACFSSLLVLGAVDTFVVWFFVAYKKTQDLMEWLVVPFIVAFSLIVGFLNAVFLGIGISTFVFVAAFFRIGVVKFNATGLEIRSTIERSMIISDWLDAHGDFIQVLVLQNYLFFGNASSISTYISTMFEEMDMTDPGNSIGELPPVPKVLIIDLSLNTGMDTSTLDIFAEIKELCKNNKCKLFLCGLSSRAKKGLALTGVKTETGPRDQRLVRFFPDLDTALGRAEDFIALDMQEKENLDITRQSKSQNSASSGFQRALKFIDEQHGQEFSKNLLDIEPHTRPIELQAGERLFACDGGQVEDNERGLFFIESGMLKIERDAGNTLTRGRGNTLTRNRSFGTLNNLHARSGTLGRQRAALKAVSREPMTRTFRLARLGPGWVCGAIEGASGLKHDGVHIAVTNCRLHHLTFQKLEQMETNHPALVVTLYKMLSHLMARRQEITIEQLATFHSIMSSPAHSKPVSRAAIMAFRR